MADDLADLDTPEARDVATKGTVEDWATESLLAARQSYQVPETGKRPKSGQKLGDAHLQANLPAVRRRLDQACGWRWCSMRSLSRNDGE